jgi:hypothetical protein
VQSQQGEAVKQGEVSSERMYLHQLYTAAALCLHPLAQHSVRHLVAQHTSWYINYKQLRFVRSPPLPPPLMLLLLQVGHT